MNTTILTTVRGVTLGLPPAARGPACSGLATASKTASRMCTCVRASRSRSGAPSSCSTSGFSTAEKVTKYTFSIPFFHCRAKSRRHMASVGRRAEGRCVFRARRPEPVAKESVRDSWLRGRGPYTATHYLARLCKKGILVSCLLLLAPALRCCSLGCGGGRPNNWHNNMLLPQHVYLAPGIHSGVLGGGCALMVLSGCR
jgi:hypothetical protein